MATICQVRLCYRDSPVKVRCLYQCSKMRFITFQNFYIRTCFSQFLWFFSLKCWFKWRIGSQTSTEGRGKNEKKKIFLLGFKYTLRTCFESKNFLPKSCPELSNQVLSFSGGQIYYRHSYFNAVFWAWRKPC